MEKADAIIIGAGVIGLSIAVIGKGLAVKSRNIARNFAIKFLR